MNFEICKKESNFLSVMAVDNCKKAYANFGRLTLGYLSESW